MEWTLSHRDALVHLSTMNGVLAVTALPCLLWDGSSLKVFFPSNHSSDLSHITGRNVLGHLALLPCKNIQHFQIYFSQWNQLYPTKQQSPTTEQNRAERNYLFQGSRSGNHLKFLEYHPPPNSIENISSNHVIYGISSEPSCSSCDAIEWKRRKKGLQCSNSWLQDQMLIKPIIRARISVWMLYLVLFV